MGVLYKNSSGDVVSLIPEINNIDDSTIAADTTYSSEKIEGSYPITTTATGSDLTLSTSSGNLNALTVYGKSEVVDGDIRSAGEGYAVVDLGTLNWGYESYQTPIFTTLLSAIGGVSNSINFICPKYKSKASFWREANNDMCIASGSSNLCISNSQYTNESDFKTAMSGVLLCYELANPTQGNTIAIKTDDGSGTNGTMATFTTGTPLRGIPDTTVRDVMTWNGSSGEVTKNCREVDLGTLTWSYTADYNLFTGTGLYSQSTLTTKHGICSKYPEFNIWITDDRWASADKFFSLVGNDNYIRIKDTAYSDAATFKTAILTSPYTSNSLAH